MLGLQHRQAAFCETRCMLCLLHELFACFSRDVDLRADAGSLFLRDDSFLGQPLGDEAEVGGQAFAQPAVVVERVAECLGVGDEASEEDGFLHGQFGRALVEVEG